VRALKWRFIRHFLPLDWKLF